MISPISVTTREILSSFSPSCDFFLLFFSLSFEYPALVMWIRLSLTMRHQDAPILMASIWMIARTVVLVTVYFSFCNFFTCSLFSTSAIMCLFIQCIFDLEIELLLVLISSASFRISTGSQSAPKVASRIQVCLHTRIWTEELGRCVRSNVQMLVAVDRCSVF